MRLFTAINLPVPVREHLSNVQGYLKATVGFAGVKWTASDNLHITLKFLGEVNAERLAALKARLSPIRFTPATLFATRIGAFPNGGRAHVITVNPGGELLSVSSLFDEIDQACEAVGFARDLRTFTPHVTIGRSQRGCDIRRAQVELPKLFPGPSFTSRTFEMMASTLTPTGPVYEVLQSYGGLAR